VTQAIEKMIPEAKHETSQESTFVNQIKEYTKKSEPALRKDIENLRKKILHID
jgi:hypothetical protein